MSLAGALTWLVNSSLGGRYVRRLKAAWKVAELSPRNRITAHCCGINLLAAREQDEQAQRRPATTVLVALITLPPEVGASVIVRWR